MRVRIGALAAAGACAASLALAASSQAEVMTATWNGFVQNGIDYTGVFGAPGATLTGLTFQAVYTMDDNVPGATRIVASTLHDPYGSSMSHVLFQAGGSASCNCLSNGRLSPLSWRSTLSWLGATCLTSPDPIITA